MEKRIYALRDFYKRELKGTNFENYYSRRATVSQSLPVVELGA